MMERWGISVSDGLYNTLVSSIRNRKSYVIESQGSTVIHIVRCSRRLIPVVYDSKRKVLVSALPKRVLQQVPTKVRKRLEAKKPWKKATKRTGQIRSEEGLRI